MRRSRPAAFPAGLALGAALSLGACATGGGEEWKFTPYEAPRFTYSAEFGGVYHTVERGQTMWRIARAYGVDLDRLQWVNGVEDVTRIAAGRKLFVPGVRQVIGVSPYLPGESAPPVKGLEAPLQWPLLPRQVAGAVFTSVFGPRRGGRGSDQHTGVDMPSLEGTPIEAAGSGVVVFAGAGMSGYGNAVVLKHNEDWSTVYAHNAINLVKDGQKVEKGDVIAEVGKTGRATGPHLHFEVRKRGVPQDPVPLLPPWDEEGK